MKIEHVALYVHDLEGARTFFMKYLGANQTADITIPGRIFARIFFRSTAVRGLNLCISRE